MRKILLSVVLATSLAFTSCQYDDSDIWGKLDEYGESIKDHEERISTLEELCKQMNTNISAMQSIIEALENCDYIINVSPIYKDGEEIGYTISFAYSGTITIYHGIDGADGKNGDAPQIGVKKDADGIYYWTLDGEWMLDANGEKIKAVGIDGKDGQNGQDGANGSNGSNGTNGNDGITPRLKIENDYWYVSYDNGTTWVQLGKATGENGKDGNDGINSIIIGVEESETEVVFILSDNTTITIPKHSKSSLVDPDDICSAMDDVKFMEYCYQNFDVNKDGKVSPFEAKAVRNIDISGLDIYSINGVEYFEILESLKAENTPLRNIDISFNNKLISFSFRNCSSITSLALPNNITAIGAGSFYGCSSLKSITIPDSVTSIGKLAFYDCDSLEEFMGNLASSDGRCLIINGVLNNFASAGLTKYSIPNNITSIGECAFYGCNSLTSVIIPNSVTSIESYAFSGCSSLTNVTIPNSVTSIGEYVFWYCDSLRSITIPDSVTSFGASAFDGCSGKLIINSKVVEIDYNNSYPTSSSGWLYGSKFSELIIGSNVEKIGSFAFRDCNSLKSITISDSVTSISESAFRGCI